MATIIAIGGDEVGELLETGEVAPVQTESIHKEILSRTNKKHPRVLYIPTAKDDTESYIAGFRKYYTGLGYCDVDVLRLIRETPTSSEIEAKITAADVVYVNGGNTHRMMRIWKRYGVDDMLKKAHRNGTIMAGHSAGAICWFTDGDSDSYNRKHSFRASGLRIIDALLCPHYDTEPFRRADLKTIMARTPRLVAITLDECAAIEIIDGEYRLLASTRTASGRRAFWKNNKYVVENLPINEQFQALKPLLTKS